MADENTTTTETQPAVETPAPVEPSTQQWAEAMRAAQMGEEYTPAEPVITPAPEETTSPAEQEPAVATPEVVPPAAEVPATPSFSWEQVSGGKVKDETEFQNIFQEYQALKENPVAALPPAEQKLLQLHRSGQDVMSYVQFQNTDLAKMDAMEVLRFQFNQEHKDAPKDILEDLWEEKLQKDYPNLDAFGEDEQKAKVARWKLNQAAESTRQVLLDKQKEMAIPAPEAASTTGTPAPAPYQPTEAEIAAYSQKARQAASFSSIPVDVQVGETKTVLNVPFTPTPEFAATVETAGDFMLKRWQNTDGSENLSQIAKDIAKLQSYEVAVSHAYAEGLKHSSQQIKQTLENPEPLVSNAPQGNHQPTAREWAQAMRQALESRNYNN